MKERWISVALLLMSSTSASAATLSAQMSLNACQRTVKTESTKFIKGEVVAITTCLQRISVEVIQNNAANVANAARTCISQFRKINDSRGLGKSLKEKLTTKIRNKCDPTF